MRPLWHPLSTLLLADPPTFASPMLLRRLLSRGASVELLYAGDRMWPAVRHGARVRVEPLRGRPVAGDVVVASPGGVPDLLRIEAAHGDRWRLCGDADPDEPGIVPEDALLGRATLPRRHVGALRRAARRARLDVGEALRGIGPPEPDPASGVLRKYDTQAPFYAGGDAGALPAEVLETLARHVSPGERLLVAGSGTGRECWTLAERGWRVSGVDFSPAMVEAARREAARRSLAVDFRLGDLRTHQEPAGSLGGLLFTYDVYSFLPRRSERVALLSRMLDWLAPTGVILISARRVRGVWAPCLLTAEWLGGLARGHRTAWGASHTRWIGPDGNLQRSFVQVFRDRALRDEIRRAGLELGAWTGGHAVLRRPA